ncbi:MAG: hypothetical protein A2Y36_09200 [Treponema sp. GWA1_62_8]|nr:MAG: hypothetical protein A2Y36_09200 [Treponema sp. GWA1_62_8]
MDPDVFLGVEAFVPVQVVLLDDGGGEVGIQRPVGPETRANGARVFELQSGLQGHVGMGERKIRGEDRECKYAGELFHGLILPEGRRSEKALAVLARSYPKSRQLSGKHEAAGTWMARCFDCHS